ncbi:hypothetical protein J7443_17610 [Tropicibacter sp. R15_0]|uniref:hypothetical protein n=1 Tax=Tropicibacter sp. R15_0 TaxID=2821101 RepID=UPI001ADD12E0|nr:hypothetical protein [Tropicibacter sp. R15_0]MBO9467065.1 hypothetical protein [Tropicibacter sp. R15_0]
MFSIIYKPLLDDFKSMLFFGALNLVTWPPCFRRKTVTILSCKRYMTNVVAQKRSNPASHTQRKRKAASPRPGKQVIPLCAKLMEHFMDKQASANMNRKSPQKNRRWSLSFLTELSWKKLNFRLMFDFWRGKSKKS